MKRIYKVVAVGVFGILGSLGLASKGHAAVDLDKITRTTPLQLDQLHSNPSGSTGVDTAYGHYSHMSHRSHYSHYSHYSGY